MPGRPGDVCRHGARTRSARGAARGLRAGSDSQRRPQGQVARRRGCGARRSSLPGLLDAWRIVSRRRPDVVIGVGGYSSGPVVLMAALRRRADAGARAERGAGSDQSSAGARGRAAAVTYDDTLRVLSAGGAFVAGNPVRAEFFHGRQPATGGAAPPRVLILGGSQGAHAINVAVVAAAADLARSTPGLEIVHQTGERDRAVGAGTVRGRGRARAGGTRFSIPWLPNDERGPRDLPRRRDDAGRAGGGRPAGGAHSVSGGDRRPPAQERAGARGRGRGGRDRRARSDAPNGWPT